MKSTCVDQHVQCGSFTQLTSRKRPFSAVSQLQPRLSNANIHNSRLVGTSVRSASASSQQPRCLARAQAASVDTEDLVTTPERSDKARPQIEPLPQQQPRFDWCDQWYAIGYEK